MKKTILFRRLRNFVYAMMLPGMAMFIGSCSDESNWERLPDRQRDDVQVRPEVKSDEEWEYSFFVNGLCGEGADSASVFMADWPDRVWVGNVFPEADFGAGFENNIPYPEMSLTLRTDFPPTIRRTLYFEWASVHELSEIFEEPDSFGRIQGLCQDRQPWGICGSLLFGIQLSRRDEKHTGREKPDVGTGPVASF